MLSLQNQSSLLRCLSKADVLCDVGKLYLHSGKLIYTRITENPIYFKDCYADKRMHKIQKDLLYVNLDSF